ncbi:MAG TPA: efflux RND transporter periplasmic adaptor subunit [Vicinamibacterales bacterium]
MTSRLRYLPLIVLTAVAPAGCGNDVDPDAVHLNGRIEAPMVDLAPKVTGRVVEVRVREGDRVKAGDLLVRLDLGETALAVEREKAAVASAQSRLRDLEAGSRTTEIAAAEAELSDRRAAYELARKELERQQFMLSRKVSTQRDVDRATTDLERAKAAVAAAENRLALLREGARRWQIAQAEGDLARAKTVLEQSRTVESESEIRAPADGVVLHRLVEPGQLVGPAQPAVTLAFADRLYVRTFIPETALGRVKQGQAAEIVVDAHPGRTFKGRVTEIARDAEFTPKAVETRVERVNLVYAAEVDIEGAWDVPLVPGQPAEVVVRTTAEGAAP